MKKWKLYQSLTTDKPELNAWLHKRMLVFWIILTPVAMITPLKESIEFLVGISLVAIIISEWGAYQQAKAEINLDEKIEPMIEELESGD